MADVLSTICTFSLGSCRISRWTSSRYSMTRPVLWWLVLIWTRSAESVALWVKCAIFISTAYAVKLVILMVIKLVIQAVRTETDILTWKSFNNSSNQVFFAISWPLSKRVTNSSQSVYKYFKVDLVTLWKKIAGTGCNAAYVEKVENVDKWNGDQHESPVVWQCIRYAV